jgi:ketosteroid isomerase-like protein
MKATFVAAVVGTVGFATLCAEETKISEDAVLRVIAAIQNAASKKDASALLSHLAEDFTLTAKHPDGSVKARMTLAEYKAFVEKMFTKGAAYNHSQGKVAVEIAENGKTATARFETFQYEERPDKEKLTWTNLETDTFVLKDGKLLLKSVETALLLPGSFRQGPPPSGPQATPTP